MLSHGFIGYLEQHLTLYYADPPIAFPQPVYFNFYLASASCIAVDVLQNLLKQSNRL